MLVDCVACDDEIEVSTEAFKDKYTIYIRCENCGTKLEITEDGDVEEIPDPEEDGDDKDEDE